eukprot:2533202-Alexandrium_andersonii.AAC.1
MQTTGMLRASHGVASGSFRRVSAKQKRWTAPTSVGKRRPAIETASGRLLQAVSGAVRRFPALVAFQRCLCFVFAERRLKLPEVELVAYWWFACCPC